MRQVTLSRRLPPTAALAKTRKLEGNATVDIDFPRGLDAEDGKVDAYGLPVPAPLKEEGFRGIQKCSWPARG